MRNTPRIRGLRPGDREAWDELWQRYLRFYRATVGDDVADHTFARLCAGDELVALVAVDGADRPIGLAHLVFHPSTWTTQPYCYLEDLYVHPDHRGADVARASMPFPLPPASAGRRVSTGSRSSTTERPARSTTSSGGSPPSSCTSGMCEPATGMMLST